MTTRVLLRRWRPEDREPFAALNADRQVMRYFPATLSREDSDALIDRIEAHFEQLGFGLWAVEIPGVTPFAGFTGLAVPRFEAFFTPCVEIGWRFASAFWGRGYATEAAQIALASGFERHNLNQIVSFTAIDNLPSIRVMQRLGMTFDREFDHPSLPIGHPLQRHVLYRRSA